MKSIVGSLLLVIFLLTASSAIAQGPPILGDKPIMLGANRVVIKTLSELRRTKEGTFLRAPIMAHYLPTSNMLVGAYIPMVYYNFEKPTIHEDEAAAILGDIELVYKYQFYRKDGMGKTFRVVAKTLQTLPTGKKLNLEGMSTGVYQGYYGIVAGYESIKYGLSGEMGYNWSPLDAQDEVRTKFSVGLPLLKPSYPVNQINLFFEYQNSWLVENNELLLLYGQGIQYAKGRLTVEVAVQLPLFQSIPDERRRLYSIFFGMRYVI